MSQDFAAWPELRHWLRLRGCIRRRARRGKYRRRRLRPGAADRCRAWYRDIPDRWHRRACGPGVAGALAAGGVFLLFGLWSGFLRLSERAAEADIVKTATDGLASGLQIVDRTGAVIYRNLALRLTGTRTGRQATLEELFAGEPQSAEAFYRLNRAAERGEARDEEFYVRSAALDAAAGCWLQVSVHPFPTPSGRGREARLTLWQVRDVTRERTREIETVSGLRATLAFYDDFPQGLLAVAADGRIAHVNATLAHSASALAARAVASMLADIVSPEGADLIRAAARAGRVTRFDSYSLREDGRAVPVHLVCRDTDCAACSRSWCSTAARRSRTGRGPRGAAGRPGHAGGSLRHRHGRRRWPHRQCQLGLHAHVPGRGRRSRERCQPGSAADERAGAELAKALQRAYSGRTVATSVEVFIGARREFARRIYVTPLGLGTRAREGAILYAIDATEQKALELKFAHSHKMEAVGQLAGGVAHDFNNVLTAYHRLLRSAPADAPPHRSRLSRHHEHQEQREPGRRPRAPAARLLAAPDPEAQALELQALHRLSPALLNKALGEKIALKILPGRDLWHVKADKTQFEHVIINLAVNASDAMPAAGCSFPTRNVSARASLRQQGRRRAGEYVRASRWSDDRRRHPARCHRPHLRAVLHDQGGGQGHRARPLHGLWHRQADGRLYLVDSEVGKGTTFRVYLPRHIVESEDEFPQRARKAEVTRDLTGAGRVLLVEDEDVVRSFAARALSRQGYEVPEAGTGVEALEIMQREQRRVDLVVSDVIMPEMDGPTLLKELRKTKPDLKFIFVSGYPDDAFRKSLDDGQDYAFLPKPFTLPQLAAKVKEELGR